MTQDFYKEHFQDYTDVTNAFKQSNYILTSSTEIQGDHDLRELLLERCIAQRAENKFGTTNNSVVIKSKLLDVGCGPGARDVLFYLKQGLDAYGIDGSSFVVQETIKKHQNELSLTKDNSSGDGKRQFRLQTHDAGTTFPFPDETFDIVTCNAVIQHLSVEGARKCVQELVRVLKPGGYLQLMFKCGHGETTIHDSDYKCDRRFRLFPLETVVNDWLSAAERSKIKLLPFKNGQSHLLFSDPKPSVHCVIVGNKI